MTSRVHKPHDCKREGLPQEETLLPKRESLRHVPCPVPCRETLSLSDHPDIYRPLPVVRDMRCLGAQQPVLNSLARPH